MRKFLDLNLSTKFKERGGDKRKEMEKYFDNAS